MPQGSQILREERSTYLPVNGEDCRNSPLKCWERSENLTS